MVTREALAAMRAVEAQDYWARLATVEIRDTYKTGVIIKPKSLHKFGRTSNADDGQATTIMTLPGAAQYNETYVADNLINSIVSSNDGDEQDVLIEGHTVSGTGVDQKFTFVVQTVTLTGQTVAALTTPLARVSRVVNAGAVDFAGTVYVHETDTVTSGVPQTDAKVHMLVVVGKNQSEKAATTVSNSDFAIITSVYASVNRGNTSNVDVELKVRNAGKAFRTQHEFSIRSTGAMAFAYDFRPFLIVDRNSDILLSATSTANDTTISGGFSALFGLVEE